MGFAGEPRGSGRMPLPTATWSAFFRSRAQFEASLAEAIGNPDNANNIICSRN
jgi:hypothetical protein